MKKRIFQRGLALVAASLLSVSVFAANGDDAVASVDELLKLIKDSSFGETKEQREREARFKREKNNQANLLKRAKAERDAQRARSERLDKQFAENDLELAKLEEQYNERLGSLKELFGHLSSAAGDVVSTLNQSITSAQYPDRTGPLVELISKTSGSATVLPKLSEIEALWYEIYREMNEGSKVVTFSGQVFSGGEQTEREVVRIGTFNLISDGEYLTYDPSTKFVSSLARQPAGKFTGSAADLQSATSGFTATGIDPTGPTGGSLLTALVDLPGWEEKWHQGKEVGYIITGIGVFALLLALWRFFVLSGVSAKVSSQLKASEARTNNPLGRVLKVSEDNPGMDAESLELKLHEAVLKERPAIESGINLLKIIAMVAPLMGLLGTVTGMIDTFQQITIFGAGDPKNMAGGISQALMTTVLGLCVAIPVTLLHTLVNGRAQRILHVLEEQSAGIVAENVEGR